MHKHTILNADLRSLCADVLSPPVALALPTQSTLLRGVVRIENKQANYLLDDALDARHRLREPARARTTLDPDKLSSK